MTLLVLNLDFFKGQIFANLSTDYYFFRLNTNPISLLLQTSSQPSLPKRFILAAISALSFSAPSKEKAPFSPKAFVQASSIDFMPASDA